MDGALFVFCSRNRRALKCLVYDSQGFWLCQKRLSSGRFAAWPRSEGASRQALSAHQLLTLLWNEQPRPFVWTATVERIMEKVERARHTLDAGKPGWSDRKRRKTPKKWKL